MKLHWLVLIVVGCLVHVSWSTNLREKLDSQGNLQSYIEMATEEKPAWIAKATADDNKLIENFKRESKKSVSNKPEEWPEELKNAFRTWLIKRECNDLWEKAYYQNTSDTTIAFANANVKPPRPTPNVGDRLLVCKDKNLEEFFRFKALDDKKLCKSTLFNDEEWESTKKDIQRLGQIAQTMSFSVRKKRFLGACRVAKSNNMTFEGPEADKMVNLLKLLDIMQNKKTPPYDPVRNNDTLTCRMYSSFGNSVPLCPSTDTSLLDVFTVEKEKKCPQGSLLDLRGDSVLGFMLEGFDDVSEISFHNANEDGTLGKKIGKSVAWKGNGGQGGKWGTLQFQCDHELCCNPKRGEKDGKQSLFVKLITTKGPQTLKVAVKDSNWKVVEDNGRRRRLLGSGNRRGNCRL